MAKCMEKQIPNLDYRDLKWVLILNSAQIGLSNINETVSDEWTRDYSVYSMCHEQNPPVSTVHSSETGPLAFESRIWAELRIKNPL